MNLSAMPIGHRERKKQRTKEKLVEAALRLFVERGYEETRIDDIVAEVDIVPRTFFRYFCSKDDALFGWFDALRREAVAALRARPRGEGIVCALNSAYLEVARAHSGQEAIALVVHQLVARSPEIRTRRSAWFQDMQHDLAQELAKRLPASACLVAEMSSAALRTAFTLAANQWAEDGAPRPLHEYTQAIAGKVLKLFDGIDNRYKLQ